MDKAQRRDGYKWYRIDKQTLSIKIAFFAEGWRRGAHWPFMFVLFISLGLTKTQAGFVNGFRLIGSLIGGPFWTMMADKTRKRQLMIFLQNTGAIVFMSIHILIDLYFTNDNTDSKDFDESEYVVQNSTATGNSSFGGLPSPEIELTNGNHTLFWFLFFLNIIVTFFDGNLESFLDAAFMRMADKLPYQCEYGFQRIFMAVGVAFGFFISDMSIRSLEKVGGVSKYTGMIISYTLSIVVLQISSFFLNRGLHNDDNILTTASQISKTKFLKFVLRVTLQPRILFLLFTFVVNGILMTFHYYFIVPLLDDMNAPPFMYVLVFVVETTSLFVGFLIGYKIMRCCRGVWNVIILSFLAYTLRFIIYSLTENLWCILASQCLGGLCFSIFVIASIYHIKDISPDEILTTMYGIRTATHLSVGFIAGNVIGGYIYDKFGGRILYGGGAVLAFIWTICVAVFACFSSKPKKLAVSNEELPLLKRNINGVNYNLTE